MHNNTWAFTNQEVKGIPLYVHTEVEHVSKSLDQYTQS